MSPVAALLLLLGAPGWAAEAAGASPEPDDKAPRDGLSRSESPPPEAGLAAGGAYVLPEPPALVLLDRPGAMFAEPSAPADFAASAGQVFGSDGKLRSGGALELGLRSFGLTRGLSAEDYLDSWGARLLTRSYLSVATAAATDGTGDVLLAVGWRSLLLDGADPYLDRAYVQAARAAVAACEKHRASDAPDWAERYGACLDKAYQAEARALSDPAWNAFGLVLSVASTFEFPDSKYVDAGGRDLAGWLSVAGPAGPAVQLGAGVGWTQALNGEPSQLGLSTLVRGGLSKARLRGELGLVLEMPTAPTAPGLSPTDLAVKLPVGMGAELLVDDALWLALSFGVVIAPATQELQLLSQGTFRWGQASNPSFMPVSQEPGRP
jgi:hypothetical protein